MLLLDGSQFRYLMCKSQNIYLKTYFVWLYTWCFMLLCPLAITIERCFEVVDSRSWPGLILPFSCLRADCKFLKQLWT